MTCPPRAPDDVSKSMSISGTVEGIEMTAIDKVERLIAASVPVLILHAGRKKAGLFIPRAGGACQARGVMNFDVD